MVKLFNKDKPAEDLVSPLMADEPSVTSGRSFSSRDGERASRRMERDKRLASSKAASVSSSKSKSSNSNKTIMTQEEQDEADVKMGCCYTFGGILVKSIHLIDGLIGLIFVIYGSLIMTQFHSPAEVASIVCLTYGAVLLFFALMGGIGFTSRVCKRCGLALSAYIALFIAFFYLVGIIALLASPDTFFNYLTDHKDVLYLSSAEIATLKQLLPFFYIVLVALGAMEMTR
jgi:hypothetical protein